MQKIPSSQHDQKQHKNTTPKLTTATQHVTSVAAIRVILCLVCIICMQNICFGLESAFQLRRLQSHSNFKRFVKRFDRDYGSPQEYWRRYQVFRQNMKIVQFLRETELGTGQYGITSEYAIFAGVLAFLHELSLDCSCCSTNHYCCCCCCSSFSSHATVVDFAAASHTNSKHFVSSSTLLYLNLPNCYIQEVSFLASHTVLLIRDISFLASRNVPFKRVVSFLPSRTVP